MRFERQRLTCFLPKFNVDRSLSSENPRATKLTAEKNELLKCVESLHPH